MKHLSSPHSLLSVGTSFTPLSEEDNTQLPGATIPNNSPFRTTPKRTVRRLRLSGFSRPDCLRLKRMDQMADTCCSESSNDGNEQGHVDHIMDPLDIPQERCPTSLPMTSHASLGHFLEQTREMSAQARKNSKSYLDLSKLSTITTGTRPRFVNLPFLPNLDIAEQLYREVNTPVSIVEARNTGEHVLFTQLRFTTDGADAYFVTAPYDRIHGSGSFVRMEDTVLVKHLNSCQRVPVTMMNSAA